jgi:hypothetical protein
MKIQQQPFYLRSLFSLGIILTVLPVAIRDWVTMPDFFRGIITGLGLGIEVTAFIIISRNRPKTN